MNKEKTYPSQDIIFERKSIRRYQHVRLDEKTWQELKSISGKVEVLHDQNILSVEFFNYEPKHSLSRSVGAFGKFMSPPHFFAPFLIGEKHSLIDLGFRNQQIVLELWKRKIGSCYIGCAHRARQVKELLTIPEDAFITTLVVFGLPDHNQSERLFRKISQAFVKSSERLPVSEVFLNGSESQYEKLDEKMRRIIDAGRYAPSAMNAQPWRFMIEDGLFIILTKGNQPGKLYDHKNAYPLHDVGVCMANMTVMAKNIGLPLKWQWIKNPSNHLMDDKKLIPVSTIKLSEYGSSS